MQLVQLGHRLARLTGDREYSERAGRVWTWVRGAGLLNMSSYQVRACSLQHCSSWPLQVYDGVSLATCRVNTNQTFSYTAGTLVGGLVEWYRLDHNSSHLELAHNIASSVIR